MKQTSTLIAFAMMASIASLTPSSAQADQAHWDGGRDNASFVAEQTMPAIRIETGDVALGAGPVTVAHATQPQAPLATPSIRFVGAQPCTRAGLSAVCYEISVLNRQDYPNALFDLLPMSTGCQVRVNVYDAIRPGFPFLMLCPETRNELKALEVWIAKGRYETGYVWVRIHDGATSRISAPSNGVRLYEPPRPPTGVRPSVRPPITPR